MVQPEQSQGPNAGSVARLSRRFQEYRTFAALAQSQTGKPLRAQLSEIAALRRLGGQCGISDYYWHKLYDDEYLKGRGRRDFLGWRLLEEFSRALNPRDAVLPAWDKMVFTLLAQSCGLPVAPSVACFHRTDRISDVFGIHLRTRQDAAAFLRNPDNYPLFGKPSYSQGGRGSAYLSEFDESADSILMLDGAKVAVDSFIDRLEHTVDRQFHKPQCGYLFQAPLRLATDVFALTQWQSICSVRIVCLNGPQGVQPIRAAWKIAVPPNHADNFGMGDRGNLLADVDIETGEISRVIGGFWPSTEVFSAHPLTGRSFAGFRLPGWSQVLNICAKAGEVFPLMKIHHWDIALTDRGPQILELNDIGGTQIPQMHGRGLLTEATRDFLKRHADRTAHPWVKSL